MKRLIILICCCFAIQISHGQDSTAPVSLPQQPSNPNDWLDYARNMYFAFGTDNCPQQTLYNYLESLNVQNNILFDAYESVSKLASAECDDGLFAKLAAWNQAKTGFDSIVNAEPNNPEIHFLQLGIAIHAPSFVHYSNYVGPDEATLIDGIIANPEGFNDNAYTLRVIDWIFKHITTLTAQQQDDLTALKNKLSQ